MTTATVSLAHTSGGVGPSRRWTTMGIGGQEPTGTGFEMKTKVTGSKEDIHSHKVTLEEVLQLPLRCRISQVSDVQAATFGSAGKDSVVGGRLVVGGLASDRGVGQSVGNVIDGSGRGVGDFLHDGRHGD